MDYSECSVIVYFLDLLLIQNERYSIPFSSAPDRKTNEMNRIRFTRNGENMHSARSAKRLLYASLNSSFFLAACCTSQSPEMSEGQIYFLFLHISIYISII